jgi:hypothetical protein
VRLLAYDEHRLGLRPVYRRVWARRGERPLAVGAHRYRWFYVCTFVEPETGESLSLLVDGVDTEVMGWVLRELRAWLGEGEEAWVVLDRAGWHVSGRVEVPEGVRLVFLPPYSPELQPVERVWPLVNEAVANRYFLIQPPQLRHFYPASHVMSCMLCPSASSITSFGVR